MFFEITGFLFGMTAIGAALGLLYWRETSRVMGAIQGRPGARQRG
jgi:hypothetical protein